MERDNNDYLTKRDTLGLIFFVIFFIDLFCAAIIVDNGSYPDYSGIGLERYIFSPQSLVILFSLSTYLLAPRLEEAWKEFLEMDN